MDVWTTLMLVSGGMFAGGAATFSWSRVPIWRAMPVAEFVTDFASTISRTDKVQPALLVTAIVSSLGFGLTADGSAAVLGWIGAAGLVVTLAASVAVLVPLQRRIVAVAATQGAAGDEMRQRWFRKQHGRAVLATASFASLALAAAA